MCVQCEVVSNLDTKSTVLPERIAILVPAYNEARHLERLIAACRAVQPAILVIVDDCSKDDTQEVLAKVQASITDGFVLHVIKNEKNLGKQGSVRAGLRFLHDVPVDGVALIDGDMQHDPAELPALARLLSHFDAVIGARSHAEMPKRRRFANWFVNAGFRAIAGVNFVDVQSGLRLYKKPLADMLGERLKERGGYGVEHESLTALAAWCIEQHTCVRIAAAPITCAYGDAESKVRPKDIAKLAFETFRQARRFRRMSRRPASRATRALPNAREAR